MAREITPLLVFSDLPLEFTVAHCKIRAHGSALLIQADVSSQTASGVSCALNPGPRTAAAVVRARLTQVQAAPS